MEEFENDYKYLRKLVVAGKISAASAKLWLNDHNEKRRDDLAISFVKGLPKWGTRAARDLKIFEGMDD